MKIDNIMKEVTGPALVASGITRQELNKVIGAGNHMETCHILFHANFSIMKYILSLISAKDYTKYNRRDLGKAWEMSVKKTNDYWHKYCAAEEEYNKQFEKQDQSPIGNTIIE